ncbi:MAG: class I SAM-dependent methyltransferase [Elusimicrobiota bacterium]|jgi:SAM-dependent methyltransferase|nr:class I SAM-dependent methyltransferase [Elusimicrobiota bacterium]
MADLSNFPKVRSPLPQEYSDVYKNWYSINRNGGNAMSFLSQKMESWMHKQIAKDSSQAQQYVLELGAGTLNHLKYEKNVKHYDIVEPFKSLFENSPNLSRVRNIYADIADIPIENKYDRIISCAVLEHIENLPEVIAKAALMLCGGEGGAEKLRVKSEELRIAGGAPAALSSKFLAGIPSEGGLLWKNSWRFTTGLSYRLKYHLKYDVLMKYEHINTADEIIEVIRHFFEIVKIKRFGFGKHLSLYTFIEASHPYLEKCKKFLSDGK